MGHRIWAKRAIMLALLLGVSACAKGINQNVVDDNTSPQQIIALADAQVARGKFARAGDLYLEVERLYPYTVEAEFAVIQAAKAYQGGKKRLESRAAAQRYIDYYPAGQYAALAHYLVALSYYDQIVDVGRDQENTFQALQALRIVIGTDRRLQTNRMIEELLQERQQMWNLYWELAELKPFDRHKEPLEQVLDRFCQIMIDYISLGHFGIYRRIIEGTERRRRVLEAAEKLYPAIAEATEVALKFNDQYENAQLTDHDVLRRELSKLGEALATRIELEDQLIAAMRR